MDYLKQYNFSDDMIKEITEVNDYSDVNEIIMHEERVKEVLDFLISKGITNLYNLFLDRIYLFYNDKVSIEQTFNNCNIDNIIYLINEDSVNFELINL